jgi:hypothetical protein
MTNYREILQSISQRLGCANTSLPLEDRDSLLEQLQQPIEQQRNEIAANDGERVCYTTKLDTAQSSKNIEDLKSDLEDSQAEDIIHAVDRDGNPFTYTLRDLFWSQDAYDYLKEQEKSFEVHLPELIDRYGGQFLLFEDGRVIDADLSEDALLDRISETDFFKDREGILCTFVPNREVNA